MQINYTGTSFADLSEIVNFIESQNTIGAGTRWLNRFEAFLTRSLNMPSIIKLCHNKTFLELNLRCLNYNDWVIAFSINENTILIEAILHASRLTD